MEQALKRRALMVNVSMNSLVFIVFPPVGLNVIKQLIYLNECKYYTKVRYACSEFAMKFLLMNKCKKMVKRTKIRYHFYFFLLDPVELLVVPGSFFREEEDFSTVRLLFPGDRVDFISFERPALVDLASVERVLTVGFLSSVLTFDRLLLLLTVAELFDGTGLPGRAVEVDVLAPGEFTCPDEVREISLLLLSSPVLLRTVLSGGLACDRDTVDCSLFLSGVLLIAFRLFSDPCRVRAWDALLVTVVPVLCWTERSGSCTVVRDPGEEVL